MTDPIPPEPELTPGQRYDQLAAELASHRMKPKGSRPVDTVPGDPAVVLAGELAQYGLRPQGSPRGSAPSSLAVELAAYGLTARSTH